MAWKTDVRYETSALSEETAAAPRYMGRSGGGKREGRGGVKAWIKGRSQRKDYDTFDSNVQIVSFKGGRERERQ